MSIEHIIFDLDGTLVDSVNVCTEIINTMLVDRGSAVLVQGEDVRPYLSVGSAPMMAALLGGFCSDPEADIAEFRRRYAELRTPLDCLFPGVADGLKALDDAGYRLGICSNKPQNLCEKVVTETGIAHHFGVIIGGRSGVPAKPMPDLLDLTMRKVGASASTSIFVGDSNVDQMVANARGLAFVAVSYGYGHDGWADTQPHVYDDFSVLIGSILNQPGAVCRTRTTPQKYHVSI